MSTVDPQLAAERRMHLGEDHVLTRVADLTALATKPAAYWADLAYALLDATEALYNTHRSSCADTGCRTCLAIGELITQYDAHDRLQPSGCGCPDHTTVPNRRATWDVTP